MRKTKGKPFFGRTTSGRSCAFCVDGVDGTFVGKNFGQQIDSLHKLKAFQDTAKCKAYVDTKRRKALAAVKEWVRDNQPSQFFAVWTSETDFYKDDSVEIFYAKEEDEQG